MPTALDSDLRTRDGLMLARRDWPCAAARGSVLIVHGLGEHAGRYEALAAQLNASGWRVAAYDQRGHGRSGGARGALPDDAALLRDLATAIDAQRATAAAGPLVLLGHSMGGLVAARFVAEALAAQPAAWSRPIDALVLSSPALAADTNPFQKFLLATLGALAPNLAVNNGLKPDWISRDAAVVSAYQADPLVHDRITPRLARFILDSGVLVRERALRWAVPTLLLWAGADRCVAPAGSAAFATTAPAEVVTSQVFPALFHEIFNEPERAEVFAALQAWLAARPS